jgi:hypothetical protein
VKGCMYVRHMRVYISGWIRVVYEGPPIDRFQDARLREQIGWMSFFPFFG